MTARMMFWRLLWPGRRGLGDQSNRAIAQAMSVSEVRVGTCLQGEAAEEGLLVEKHGPDNTTACQEAEGAPSELRYARAVCSGEAADREEADQHECDRKEFVLNVGHLGQKICDVLRFLHVGGLAGLVMVGVATRGSGGLHAVYSVHIPATAGTINGQEVGKETGGLAGRVAFAALVLGSALDGGWIAVVAERRGLGFWRAWWEAMAGERTAQRQCWAVLFGEGTR